MTFVSSGTFPTHALTHAWNMQLKLEIIQCTGCFRLVFSRFFETAHLSFAIYTVYAATMSMP